MPSRRSLAWLALLVLAAAITYGIAQKRNYIRDFGVYRTAAIRVLHAEPLYRADDAEYQYKYWPAFALAMIPFAWLPFEAGKLLWFILSIALLAACIRMSIAELPGRQLSIAALATWIVLLIGKYMVRELVNGQTNSLFALVILYALVAVGRARPALAGALVGIAVFIKPYALLIVLWIFVTQGAAGILSASAVMIVGLLLPAAVYGWQGNLALLGDWYRTVSTTTPTTLTVRENVSFASMWAKWIGAGALSWGLTAATSAVALALAAAVWMRRRGLPRPEYLEVSLLLMLVPLLSPQGWDYVLLIAAPAYALLVDRFTSSSLSWRAVTAVGFATTSFLFYDLEGRRLYFTLTEHSVLAAGTVVLVAALAHLRFRSAA